MSYSAAMSWTDGHLDLAYLAVNGRNLREELSNADAGCVTFPALRKGNVDLCFGTIFTEPNDNPAPRSYTYSPNSPDEAEAAGLLQLNQYQCWDDLGELKLIRSSADLDQPHERLGVVLLMENADPIRSPDAVPEWHRRGLRIVGLTWATGSRYATGNSCKSGSTGLTAVGLELVRALDEAAIIHDVSHLSDAAFDELLAQARGPVIASHSNCRSLLDDRQRHLRDDQIRAIADRGGVIGLNLYSDFLACGRRATIADCVAHLNHVCGIAGHHKCVGLGSDMDGGFGVEALPIALDHPAKLHRLSEALADAGWTDQQISGFRSDNWRRFMKCHLP